MTCAIVGDAYIIYLKSLLFDFVNTRGQIASFLHVNMVNAYKKNIVYILLLMLLYSNFVRVGGIEFTQKSNVFGYKCIYKLAYV